MQSILENKLAIVKYNPGWNKMSETWTKESNIQMREINTNVTESLMQLNEVAKKYPFCIMYHTKKNDPL